MLESTKTQKPPKHRQLHLHSRYQCWMEMPQLPRLALPLIRNSKAKLDRLQRMYRLKNKKQKRGFRIEVNSKRRARPACQGAGSRTIPCGKVASVSRNAAKIRLACKGVIIPGEAAWNSSTDLRLPCTLLCPMYDSSPCCCT